MYNTFMMKFLLIILFLATGAGCAFNETYNPVAASTSGTFELNQSALKKVTLGMLQPQVHQLMGETIIVGYNYADDVHGTATPLTLQNPYKTSAAADGCVVEYYATSVVIPDGVVSDAELLPLKFCQGKLVAKGWDSAK